MFKAVLFDAYGTLLDVDAAAAQLAQTGRFPKLQECWPELAAIWRSRQLNYSWLRSLSRSYKPFWEITADALDYAMEALGLSDPDMREALLHLYRELAPYEDATIALEAVAARGLPAAVLSNGNHEMLHTAFTASGLMDRLDALLSVEDAGIFKPAPEVYQLGLEKYSARPEEILFVSSNGWDACAAGQFGFRTIWANRANMPVERLPEPPHHIVTDLTAIGQYL